VSGPLFWYQDATAVHIVTIALLASLGFGVVKNPCSAPASTTRSKNRC